MRHVSDEWGKAPAEGTIDYRDRSVRRRYSVPSSARSSCFTEYSVRTGSTQPDFDYLDDSFDRDSWCNTLTPDMVMYPDFQRHDRSQTQPKSGVHSPQLQQSRSEHLLGVRSVPECHGCHGLSILPSSSVREPLLSESTTLQRPICGKPPIVPPKPKNYQLINGNVQSLHSAQTNHMPELPPRTPLNVLQPPLQRKPTPAKEFWEPRWLSKPEKDAQQLPVPSQQKQVTTQSPQPPKPLHRTLPPALPPKPSQDNIQPARPPKPSQDNIQPARPPKPSQDNIQPARPPKRSQDTVQPALPPKPSQDTVQPALPPKPSQDTVQPALPPKPSEDIVQPIQPSKPSQQTQPAQLPPRPQKTSQETLLKQLERGQVHETSPPPADRIEQPLALPQRLNWTPSSSDDETTTTSVAPLSPPLPQMPNQHSHSHHSRSGTVQPHCILKRRFLIAASAGSLILSMASILFLVLVLINPFIYHWHQRTFKEGTYKTCVKCFSLMLNMTDDEHNSDIKILNKEFVKDSVFCCAKTSLQFSSLLKLVIRQQNYIPGPEVDDTERVTSTHRQLTKSGEQDMHKHFYMKIGSETEVGDSSYGLTVPASGWYYVYSSIFFKTNCDALSNKTSEHYIFRFKRFDENRSGNLAKTAHTCCTGCVSERKSSFAGGVFELQKGDKIAIKVTSTSVVSDTDISYMGYTMLGNKQ